MYFLFEIQEPEKRVAKGGRGRGSLDSVSHSNFRKTRMSFVHHSRYFMCYKFKSVHFKSRVNPPPLAFL